ncbi:molybdopterin converting factor subunit 1 [Methylocystis sp. WRRC1]|uniref:molybdopterin converting factor subunit 1 n=1 Tax=unclassified Methylocystis TaxID=2625913 RepID=UPI0001F86A22|nr:MULTISPECIES: molybdopterin converting factor subunit 1 [unclassified Methylocystis]MCC3244067.1 molybdopterin converting factor subunit 1 [Methylocystis sp. WRRC1]
MKAVYFAWVRERIGLAEEEISPPQDVKTVRQLVEWLAARGEGYALAFANPKTVRAAIDKAHAAPDSPIGAAREVAFFPPMTGG